MLDSVPKIFIIIIIKKTLFTIDKVWLYFKYLNSKEIIFCKLILILLNDRIIKKNQNKFAKFFI